MDKLDRRQDGGCRGDGTSAFSCIIYAIILAGGGRHRFTGAFGYEAVHRNYSSFTTELWSFERAAMEAMKVCKLNPFGFLGGTDSRFEHAYEKFTENVDIVESREIESGKL